MPDLRRREGSVREEGIKDFKWNRGSYLSPVHRVDYEKTERISFQVIVQVYHLSVYFTPQ